jgi:ATP-dependent DNA helicase RecQ
MPAAHWDIYRAGARLPSVDSLIGLDATDQVDRLQQALSSVVCIESSMASGAAPASDDARFIGRLLLGLCCRGWPTFSSPDVEQALLTSIDPALGLQVRETGTIGNIGWRLDKDESVPEGDWSRAILDALLRGDRRLEVDEATLPMLSDSLAEQAFYRDHLTRFLGEAIGWVELQRPLNSMVREDVPDQERLGSERVDFALELPRSGGLVKVVIELDGPHHNEPTHRRIDANRDRLLENHGWQLKRVPIGTLDDGSLGYLANSLKAIIEANPFPFIHIEVDVKSLDDPIDREATRLLLMPHAIARVQLALSRALMTGVLDFGNEEWVIAVVERDTPCAELAVRDWVKTLHHLCLLYNIEITLERVRLMIAEDHRTAFVPAPWRDRAKPAIDVVAERLVGHIGTEVIDLALDVSVGCHPTRRYPADPLRHVTARHRTTLRTAQRQSGYRVDPWPAPRVISEPLDQKRSLEYFLQTLFRKQEFRQGQLPIIERVLRRDDVIGLLPTGAGKSITFQLPALLSPGLSLVIDPLKSLMQDQVENLHATGIMDAIRINSDTPRKDRPKIEWQFNHGEYRLVFISPERLQIKAFRTLLQATAGLRPIAYVVVDEAHCVSEWGHDFRTAYLNLGRIAVDYCGRNGVRPPLAALTGTASESVLRDIQRELEVDDGEAIVRPTKFARDELKFAIFPVSKGKKRQELVRLIAHMIPEGLDIPPDVLASGACGGIVFCPHASGKLGVFEVATHLRRELSQFAAGRHADQCPDDQPVAFYSGDPPKELDMGSEAYGSCKARVQRAFKEGRISLLVATSAFGMGIDKPNIRYTIHYAMAKSVEAVAQEAGRAGRDRKYAICAVLFTDRHAPDATTGKASSDCLELGISTEEAESRVRAASWDSDDAEMQMFLHTRSYQGIRRESAAVRALYHHWIAPVLPTSAETLESSTEIVIGEAEFRSEIASLMGPMLETDGQDEPGESNEDDPDQKLPHPELQRLIYRLCLLGIISDYTITYAPGNHVYTLFVRSVTDDLVNDNLFQYVARYRTSDRMNAVKQHLEESALGSSVVECATCRAINTLRWFVYEEIEQRRRQGMDNMRQMLRESSSGEDLARRINEMLSFTALTQTVFDVLDADDYRDWARIGDEIGTAESAELVYYQCRRALKDAPGHPGLLTLVALALQGMEGAHQDEVVSYLLTGRRAIQGGFSVADQQEIATWMIHELRRIAPSAASGVLNRVIRQGMDSLLAGVVLRSMAAGSLDADPILQRTSQRCLLKNIDDRVGEFMLA